MGVGTEEVGWAAGVGPAFGGETWLGCDLP